jgi:DNA (cytosine-5)-methyltransferase 1
MEKIITFGVIFGGAGASLLAARNVGLKTLWAIEPRKYFNIKTHRFNFPDTMWSQQLKAFYNMKADIVWGSPSCGEISSAGRSSKNVVNVQTKDFDEFEYVQFVQEIIDRKPIIFILENLPSVRNYLRFEATAGGTVLKHMISKKEIELPDYYIEEHRINPTEVGIAQVRDRLFVIGSLYPFRFFLKPPLEDKRGQLTIRSAFEMLEKVRSEGCVLYNDKFPKHSDEQIEKMSRLRTGESMYSGSQQRRLALDKPAPVIMGSSTRYIHPTENRTLTNRENACLMGYPLDFQFFGSENGVADQIGKSIVPQVGEYILKQAKEYLQSVDKHQLLSE